MRKKIIFKQQQKKIGVNILRTVFFNQSQFTGKPATALHHQNKLDTLRLPT